METCYPNSGEPKRMSRNEALDIAATILCNLDNYNKNAAWYRSRDLNFLADCIQNVAAKVTDLKFYTQN
jgi:hypothetical protein